MFEAIGRIFQGVIDLLAPILLPDWRALVDLLPIFLVIGVVGPLLSLLVFGWVIYVLGKPRSRIPYTDPQPHLARLVNGQPVYPIGEPYCPEHRLIFAAGTTRCAEDGRDLAVICPKCNTGRQAWIDTCGTCGLVLRIDRAAPALRTAGPPPGGAAAA